LALIRGYLGVLRNRRRPLVCGESFGEQGTRTARLPSSRAAGGIISCAVVGRCGGKFSRKEQEVGGETAFLLEGGEGREDSS